MRNYRVTTATDARVIFGVELSAGLRLFPETAPLATPYEQLNDQLDNACTTRLAARKPLAKARVNVRLSAYLMQQCIRSAAHAAEIADGGRRGPIYDALFPKGTAAEIRHRGARQAAPAAALVDRLAKSKVAGIDAFRNTWLPQLQAALGALQQAASALDAARTTYHDAFETEIALRDQHRTEVDRIMGHVRAAFPRDPAKQDVVFPEPQDDGKDAKTKGTASNGKTTATPAGTTSAPSAPATTTSAPTNATP